LWFRERNFSQLQETSILVSFPQQIVLLPIIQTSKEFELVLDPFMGSGTVGRVCDEIDRNFVGYDLKEY
jgi:DNA modification methylase